MTQPVDPSTLTTADLLSLPPTVDVETGGAAFGLGRTTSYRLAREGKFPCKVVRAGGGWRVVTADLRRVLALSGDDQAGEARAIA
ncbi:DNA-binding protein [Streptomyces salinarius]|uniref:DNA-binding protein n=1 Tax=Streptomyces salinarius TaxID=2762598 RepID=UPI002852A9AC|nr:DNA-binding protein [Streptomyces salinarius]